MYFLPFIVAAVPDVLLTLCDDQVHKALQTALEN